MAGLGVMERSMNAYIAVFLIILLPSLPYIIYGAHHSTVTRVAVWCKHPMAPASRRSLETMATHISSRFNETFVVEVFELNFSDGQVYDVLNATKEYKNVPGVFVVTSLGWKETWLWARLLGNTESLIVDLLNPSQGAPHERQFYLKNRLSLVPPESEKLQIIGDILNHMLCVEIANITCLNSEAFKNDLRTQLRMTKETNQFCIVVHCTEKLHRIFTLAKEYDLLGTRYNWFLTSYVDIDTSFPALPKNLISIELNHNAEIPRPPSTGCGDQNSLNDALLLIGSLKRENGSEFNASSIKREVQKTKFAGRTGQVYFEANLHARKGSQYGLYQLICFPNATGWLRTGSWQDGAFDTTLKSWIKHEVSRTKLPLLRITTKRSRPWMFFTALQELDEKLECNVGMKCINYTRYVSESNNSFVTHCCTGMLVELLQQLAKRVRFTPRLHFVKDKKFGSLDKATGQWNGMVGEVVRGEADTALYSLTITGSRSEIVDFTHPFIAAGSGIIVSTQVNTFYPYINYSFLRPFSSTLWIITLAIFAGCVVILSTAEGWNHRRVYGIRPRAGQSVGRLLESMSYSWGVLVQKVLQEGGPLTFSGRVVTAVFGFYMIILLSTYTANLAAIKVSEEMQTEISGIYDDKFINPTSGFRFTSSKFTSTSEFFKQSPDLRMKRIYNEMKDRLVSTRAEARALLKSGEIQAFFEDTPSLHYMASRQESCDLKVVGKSFGNSGYGMPFRRNSTWLRPISAALRKMHEDGTIRKLSQKWLESGCVLKVPNTAEELGLRDESGLFFLLAVVCVGSFLVLAVEFLCVGIFARCFDSHSKSFTYDVARQDNIKTK